MSLQRMLTMFLVMALAVAVVGCGRGGGATGPGGAPTAEDMAGSGPPGGIPPGEAMGPGGPGMGGPEGMPPGMGGPEGLPPGMTAGMGGAGGGQGGGASVGGGAPSGVDPAADLARATTLVAMGDQFMKIGAYDLAVTAYRDSLAYEPENRAHARRGFRSAMAAYQRSLQLPPPPRPQRRPPGQAPGYGAVVFAGAPLPVMDGSMYGISMDSSGMDAMSPEMPPPSAYSPPDAGGIMDYAPH